MEIFTRFFRYFVTIWCTLQLTGNCIPFLSGLVSPNWMIFKLFRVRYFFRLLMFLFFLNFSTGKISCILLGDNWYCIYLLWPQAVYNFCYEQKIASVIFFSPNEFLLLGEKNIREIRALRLVKLIPFSWFKKAVWRKERSVWKFSQPFFTFNGNMSFGPKTN